MIPTGATELVRRKVETPAADPAELGRRLIDILERRGRLLKARETYLEWFEREQRKLAEELHVALRSANGTDYFEELPCEVFFDPLSSEAILVKDGMVIETRDLTDAELEIAKRMEKARA